MARASLGVLFAMSLPACLVTSSPTFEEPKRTRPFLLSEASLPDIRQIKVVDVAQGKSLPLEFSVSVVSEDGEDMVSGQLVLDYGVSVDGLPYFQILGQPTTLVPATLDDGPRTLTARWGSAYTPTLGCHYVSLLATHNVNSYTSCPLDPADFDFLTWTVIVCDSTQGPCCDPKAPAEEGGCAAFACPAIDPDVRCGKPDGGPQ